jgi:predicted exporter
MTPLLALLGIDWSKQPPRLFMISFIITVVGYLVLIIFPRQSWANFWFSGIIAPALLGALYSVVLLVCFFAPDPRQMQELPCVTAQALAKGDATYKCDVTIVSNPQDFFSLSGLRRLFLKDGLLLAGFLDIILLSLAVAAWMARKAMQIRMPYVYLLPCLILTLGVPGTGVVLFVILSGLGGRLAQMARFEGQPPTNTMPVFARPLDVGEST